MSLEQFVAQVDLQNLEKDMLFSDDEYADEEDDQLIDGIKANKNISATN